MANGFFRCFECNKDAHELRKDYSNGILKIIICVIIILIGKLCVFCLLCEFYLRWSQMQGFEQNNDPADIIRYTNEWECLGWQLLVYLLSFLYLMLKTILLSSYGNILLIPIVIWEHDYSPLCFNLIKLFVLTSNSQAIRVILYCSRRLSPLAVCVGLLLETCIAQAFQTLPWSIPDILPFQ
uniref:Protein ARV n=1 Tax=Oncorhynchus mykiss TaxID=8022 RepID=A0A8C7WJR4_ONCMY